MIQVQELTKVFPLPGGSEIIAVNKVSFTVPPGEVYGLLGPNGAGKTTTLRMILGLLVPTSGHASIDGLASSQHPDEVKRRVGLVSASAGVYQSLSAREMLRFFADLYGVAPVEAERRLERLSALLGLDRFLDQPCATLSTGQKQRVNLARSLIHDPPVMLLDEPTLGLDVFGTQVVTEFIGHLRDEGKAVILCTHGLDEAQRLCGRFGLMDRGRIVSEGTLQELRELSGCESLVEMFLKLSRAGPALGRVAVGGPG
jgi:ABC-2 type transport system ATP-binding protein/sodium transport system ATP-binding protein